MGELNPGPHALDKSSEKLLSIGSGSGPSENFVQELEKNDR